MAAAIPPASPLPARADYESLKVAAEWYAVSYTHLDVYKRQLLALLLRRQGQVLSRTTLAEQVWDMNFDSDTNVIDVAVRRLRSKLDDPFEAKLLHTVRGMGYVLESRPEPARG